MVRRGLIAIVTLLPGCAITWTGPGDKIPQLQMNWGAAATEHRPAIEAELSQNDRRVDGWQPDGKLLEQAILDSVRDGGPPRDDSPWWQGPSRTAYAISSGDRQGADSQKELDVRLREHAELVKKHADEREKKGLDPRPPKEVDPALDAWERLKEEKGFAPIDLDPTPKPPPPPTERKGQ